MCGEKSEHDRGLAYDLGRLQTIRSGRREVINWLAGLGVLGGLIGCGDTGGGDAGGTLEEPLANNAVTSANGQCSVIPQETEGPFPADGSNGPNTLTTAGIVRNDIRSSFGGLTGTAAGTPTTLHLRLINVNDNCAPLPGYALYVWHCDANGLYSIYEVGSQNYLRGVQETNANGYSTFTTIFPGCYAGRYPHIHFEVFPSLAAAVSGANSLRVSQLALPEAVCSDVYSQTALYPQSLTRFQGLSIATDGIFSDGAENQIAAFAGTTAAGYELSLDVGIAA